MYPTSLDTTSTIPVETNTTPLSTNHVANHTAMQTAIIAIETKVGVDGSAVTTTHDYKLSEVTSTDKAVSKTATQTLTNKTLTSPVISNPTLNLTSGATGDMYYNGGSGVVTRLAAVEGKIVKVVGGVPTMATETVTVNASTTVAGISELATAAEITAGTAIGGTGASLVVTPDALASSAPSFSGSNLTGVIKVSPDYHFTTTVVASANPRGSYSDANSSTISATQTTYTKFKEIVYTDIAGTITATWQVDIVAGGTGTLYSKIYKNGVAVGAEKTASGGLTESGISVAQNDLIQVYAHMTGGDTATYDISLFRLNYDKTTVITTDYSTNTVNL